MRLCIFAQQPLLSMIQVQCKSDVTVCLIHFAVGFIIIFCNIIIIIITIDLNFIISNECKNA